ncbi:hypothetical protein V502_02705 [Pseudogymnoascus sp. VKM F-4520 (FW-2644)]|nr:hypothetical protein V502_02705 [Pseudogymnoascus sp. VKM F-4520 (FW-2644)]
MFVVFTFAGGEVARATVPDWQPRDPHFWLDWPSSHRPCQTVIVNNLQHGEVAGFLTIIWDTKALQDQSQKTLASALIMDVVDPALVTASLVLAAPSIVIAGSKSRTVEPVTAPGSGIQAHCPTTSIIPRRKVGSVPYAGSGEIRHCTEMGVVALTFDDGPSAYTDDLLDLLDQYGAKATFFITGNNNGVHEIDDCSTGYPAIIKRMYDSGHQIASHTWGHPDLSGIGEEEFDRQIYRNEMAIRNILGIIPTYIRPPYISCDYTCAQKLDEMGYHNIYFDVDTVDYWNNDAELIHNAMDNVDAAIAANGEDPSQSSFLILQHDIHYHSVYSLTEYILERMAEAGYSTATVGTCLGDPPRESTASLDSRLLDGIFDTTTVVAPVDDEAVYGEEQEEREEDRK